MSDPTDAADDDEMPEWLIDAVMSQDPPPDAVDVVKGALTWRTINVELMALAFDSLAEPAGVRDATERRTLEFTIADRSLLVEIEAGAITGQLVPPAGLTIVVIHLDGARREQVSDDGRFRFDELAPGLMHLEVRTGEESFSTPTFRVG